MIQFSLSIQLNCQKTILFQAIQLSQTVLIQTIQFSVSTVSMSKIVPFQTIQFIIQKLFCFKQFGLAKVRS